MKWAAGPERFDTRRLLETEQEFAEEHNTWLQHSFYLWHRRKSRYQEPAGHPYKKLDDEAEHIVGRLENLLLAPEGEVIRRKIDEFMNSVIPKLGNIAFERHDTPNGSSLSVVFVEAKDRKRGLHELGGGVEQTLALALVLIGEEDRGAVFIEEPEAHLHESAQRRLIRQIEKHQGQRQLFIATHSPVFVNEVREARVYRITRNTDTASIHRCISRSAQRTVLDELGVLPSSLLQTNCVVWVEGPTEMHLIEHWLKLLASDLKVHEHYAFAETGGSNIADLGADVPTGLAGLRDIMTICRNNFLVCDKDAGTDQPSKIDPQEIEGLVGKNYWITHGYEIEWYYPYSVVDALWGDDAASHIAACKDASLPFYECLASARIPALDAGGAVVVDDAGVVVEKAIHGTVSAGKRKRAYAEKAVRLPTNHEWFADERGGHLRENVLHLASFIRQSNQLARPSEENCSRCGRPMK
ncbi:ATP-dependent nuclease [Nannocystis radixulma]|uniref:AAA family ATPase n=1 Tax=Nannocystis radixulma TaxID=2995305 RepID=A0ABT5AZ78_9BACT|nr:AAA family ATPase [Nannocystis radixulma]MDC0667140.1 AAA family ATPase [Nannocystis radixulma]